MNTDLALWSLVVTALCLLGFWSRPQSFYELLMPRFVVPATIWLSTVMNAILWDKAGLPVINRAYEENAGRAMMYVAFCLVAFWVGYLTPIGRSIGRRAPYMPVDLRKHSTVFLFGSFVLLAVQQVGPTLLKFIPALAGVIAIFIRVGSFGSAALLGLYLGSRPKLNVFHYIMAAVVLSMSMMPLMDRFSRGSGLPAVIAVIAFSYMRRRVNMAPIVLAVLFMMYCGVQGLRGRAEHGHYAGRVKYLEFLVTSPPPPEALLQGARLVHDTIAPTSVGILARDEPRACTRTTSVGVWLLNCIPIPRAFGLPAYTTHFGSYIAGREIGWGYTASMFGDTRHHLGVFGAYAFLVVGIYYRAVESAAFRTFGGRDFTSEWYSFLCIVSYYALMIGLYNTFRAWFTMCAFGVYAIIALLVIRSFLGASSTPPGPIATVMSRPRPSGYV